MLAIRARRRWGLGQIFDEMGNPQDMIAASDWAAGAPTNITAPSTGVSIVNPTYGASTSNSSWETTLQQSIPSLLKIGAAAVQNLTIPKATIAGPYGVSTIPAGASPSVAGNINLGAFGGNTGLLLLGGLVLFMMMGRRS